VAVCQSVTEVGSAVCCVAMPVIMIDDRRSENADTDNGNKNTSNATRHGGLDGSASSLGRRHRLFRRSFANTCSGAVASVTKRPTRMPFFVALPSPDRVPVSAATSVLS